MTESSRPDQTGPDDRTTAEGTVHTIPEEAAVSGTGASTGSGAEAGPADSRPVPGERSGSPADEVAAPGGASAGDGREDTASSGPAGNDRTEDPAPGGSRAEDAAVGNGRSDDAAVGNGRTEEAAAGQGEQGPPRLPPPWQRTPATGGPAAADLADDRGFAEQAPPEAPTRPTRAEAPRPSRAEAPTARPEPPTERFLDDLPSGGPDLGEARTLDRDRATSSGGGIGTGPGQVNPPPGGFPAGWPRNRRPRQANLQLKRLDPWSVLKVALVLAVVLYLVWLVAVGVLYGALDGIGVWERLNGQYADLVAEQAGDRLISAARVFGVAAVIGAVNSLLFAVALSVAAFIYNVSADLVGGVEVTLSERD